MPENVENQGPAGEFAPAIPFSTSEAKSFEGCLKNQGLTSEKS